MELIFSSEFKNCLNLWSHKLNKLRFKMWKSGLIELHFWDVSELVLFKVCYDLVGLGKVGCILEVGGSLSLSYLFNSLQLLVFLQNLFFGFVDFLSSFSNDLIVTLRAVCCIASTVLWTLGMSGQRASLLFDLLRWVS